MIEIIRGSLFDSQEKFIVHQTNCISTKSAHLAKDMFAKFPYADIYSNRTTPDKPGSIVIKGDGQEQRLVIAMMGQYYPGSPKYPNSTLDGAKAREQYFYQALLKIAKIPALESVAFPYKIGCGAAGGNWDTYLGKLNNFEKYVSQTYGTKVFIYQLES